MRSDRENSASTLVLALGRDTPFGIFEAYREGVSLGLSRYGWTPEEFTFHSGDPYVVGTFVDEWGCRFETIQAGVFGEVKDPLVKDWEKDMELIHIPRELLNINAKDVNADCEQTDLFRFAGCLPRPFERLQFLRGSANLYMDLVDPPAAMRLFMKDLHQFFCEKVQTWASQTKVDAINLMDDWGSQRGLLIHPEMWRANFKPMYRDYAEIAHSYGKKVFMHSDGHILAIFPDLIEIGIDAINSQIFCMGLENLEPFAGKITFWGEIDRQWLLPHGSVAQISAAVRMVYKHLWRNGGCIAQCEFGPGARPENV